MSENPSVDMDAIRAKGRQVVDGWVRGTALLQPGEEADTWVARNMARVVESYNTRQDRPADHVVFFEAMCEAAEEAIADLQGYKSKLYGWEK